MIDEKRSYTYDSEGNMLYESVEYDLTMMVCLMKETQEYEYDSQ